MKKTLLFICIIFLACLACHSQTWHHKNAFKTTFLSFYTGSAKLTYERAVKLGQSFEITMGYIGVGFDAHHRQSQGGLFRFAYKFIFFPKEDYPLNGLYLKPELATSLFNFNSEGEQIERLGSKWGTLMACVGYQWAKRIFIVDAFVGTGIGIGNPCEYHYHHGFIDRFSLLTLTFGVKVGFTFGKRVEINS